MSQPSNRRRAGRAPRWLLWCLIALAVAGAVAVMVGAYLLGGLGLFLIADGVLALVVATQADVL